MRPRAAAAVVVAIAAAWWTARRDPAASCAPPRRFALAGDAVVLPGLPSPVPAALVIAGGKIERVLRLPPGTAGAGAVATATVAASGLLPTAFAGGAVLAPALVDVHVHANEPGRKEWEGVAAATAAAAAGGVGTLVDMPINSFPAATSAFRLRDKAATIAAAPLTVDVGLWGGLVPGNARDAAELAAMAAAGAVGFKAFLAPSGIDDFANVSLADVAAALPTLAALGLPLAVHAELIDAWPPPALPPTTLAAWAASRPPAVEVVAIRGLAAALRGLKGRAAPGFRVHIAHVSSGDAVAALKDAQREGLPMTGEACPHYLGGVPGWSADSADPGGGRPPSLLKCAPPLRDASQAKDLVRGLLDGVLGGVASDHSPTAPARKAGPFEGAWGGVAGLQYALPATWTAMKVRERRQGGQEGGREWRREAPPPPPTPPSSPLQDAAYPARLSAWMAAFPADLVGLPAKGRLVEGADADVVAWRPDASADTTPSACRHRHCANVPYIGAELRGRVLATYSRGRLVFRAGGGAPRGACGRVVRRERAA